MATADALPAVRRVQDWVRRPLLGLAPGRRGGREAVPPAPLAPEAIDFQDDLESIIAQPPPPLLGAPHHFIALLFVLLVIVSALADVDVVVVGRGRIATDAPPIVLQPLERSIVRELRVKPGDSVAKGQVLATLDPTFAEADRATLTAQQRALLAQLRRLEAEAAGAPYSPASPADPDEALQATLHAERRAQYESRLQAFDQSISGIEAAIRTTEDDRAALAEQLKVAKDVEDLRTKLFEGQTGSRLQLLAARSARLQVEQSHRNSVNRSTELRHALQSRQAERESFMTEWRRQLLEDLARIRTEAVRIDESLAKVARLADLVEVTAPEDGIVLAVARRSAGSVVREAEPLVTLIPANASLIADVLVRSSDVGYTKPGDAVEVKVDAFPYQRHGMLHGHLRSVSQESYSPDAAAGVESGGSSANSTAGAVHRAQVELEDPGLASLPDGARLIPGMTVTAEIKVGARSVLSYFLYPITRGFTESIREP